MSTAPAATPGRWARWRTIGLSLAGGAAAALAHPPFGVWPGLLGFGLLMAMLDRADGARPLRSAFWRGWLAGSAYFLISTWWVGEAFLVDIEAHGWQAPFAIGFLACGLGLLWGAAGAVYRYLAPAGARRVLVFAAVFAVFEWLRGHILTGFPWDLPGEAWRAGGWISQSASVIGAYGLSLITLAMAATAGLWGGADARRSKLVASSLALGALVLMGGFGAVRLAQPLPQTLSQMAPLRIRIVQGDIDQAVKWTPESFRAIVEIHTRLTAQPPAPGQPVPQIVVWPEAAIPADRASYLAPGTWTLGAITAALRPGQVLIMGAVRTEGEGSSAKYFNSVLVLRRDADGLVPLGVYDKHHLVPFGEYTPLDSLMGAIGFKALVKIGDGFTAGPPPAPLSVPGVPPFQPLICYEALFPAFVAGGHPRPAWIVNVSNDAWFGKTSGPWQHLNLASYRAIEEGLPMVRATPTGVSAVIDAYGRTLERLGQGAKGNIDADLPNPTPPPPYHSLKDGPFWLVVFIILSTLTRLINLRKKGVTKQLN